MALRLSKLVLSTLAPAVAVSIATGCNDERETRGWPFDGHDTERAKSPDTLGDSNGSPDGRPRDTGRTPDTSACTPPQFDDLERWKDTDDDGFNDRHDNCPDTANPEQNDADRDGIGDACDDDPSNECRRCKFDGESCSKDSECCNTDCRGGTCGHLCHPTGTTCGKDDQCCSGSCGTFGEMCLGN